MRDYKHLASQPSIKDRWDVVNNYTACLMECDESDQTCTLVCMQLHLELKTYVPPKSAFF